MKLVQRQLQLSSEFLRTNVRSGPLSVVTAILACTTLVYAILGSISPEFDYFDDDDDEKPKGSRAENN